MTVLWISDALTAGKVSRVRLPFTRLDDIHPIADVNRVRSAYMKFSVFVMSLSDVGTSIPFSLDDAPKADTAMKRSVFATLCCTSYIWIFRCYEACHIWGDAYDRLPLRLPHESCADAPFASTYDYVKKVLA